MKKRSERKKLCIRICLTVIAVVTALIFIMPIVLTISNWFMSAAEITSNYGSIFQTTDTGGKQSISQTVNLKFIPDMVTFSQYATVLFKSPDYLLKFWNSVILVVPIVVFQLVVAVLAAYGFTRTRGKLSAIVFFAYVILMMMPYQVTLVPNYLVLNWMKLLDTNWSIWLPGIFSPFSVYLITKYMRRIPVPLIEAAKIDGASKWQQIKYITLPLLKPTLITLFILSVGQIFRSDFGLFYQMPRNSGALYSVTRTLDVYVYQALMKNNDYSMSSAASVFQSVVGFVLIIAANKLVKRYESNSALF